MQKAWVQEVVASAETDGSSQCLERIAGRECERRLAGVRAQVTGPEAL